MLQQIEQFRRGELRYDELVDGLEGALDASEIKDKNLVSKWYDLWTPLEIARATKGCSIKPVEISNFLNDLVEMIETAVRHD